jgi:hypothetical protein
MAPLAAKWFAPAALRPEKWFAQAKFFFKSASEASIDVSEVMIKQNGGQIPVDH